MFMLCVCVCILIFLCFLFLLNVVISFKCVCVEDDFNAREDNERESGYHQDSNVGEEGEGGLRGRYQEVEDYTPTSIYASDCSVPFHYRGFQPLSYQSV